MATKIMLVDEYISDSQSGSPQPPRNLLSSKERELVQMLAEGLGTKEAARTLHVSAKTIDARRRSIMGKLEIDSIAHSTQYAMREGLTAV